MILNNISGFHSLHRSLRPVVVLGLVLASNLTLANSASCIKALANAETAYTLTLKQGLPRGEMRRISILENAAGEQVGLKVNKTGTQFKDLRATPLTVELDGSKIMTMMFYHKDGIAPSSAKAIVMLFHGVGADISHSGAMMPVMSYLAGPKTNKKKGSTARIHEKHIDLGVVALDGPGNGYGTSLEGMDSLKKATDLLILQIQKIKSLAPHLPLIAFARSSSTGHVVATNKRHPGLIDGMILMSPMTSEPAALAEADKGLEEDIQEAESMIAQGLKPDFVLNQEVVDWDSEIYRQMDWHEDEAGLGNVPTFVIVGDKDKQTPVMVHDFYKKQIGQISSGRGQFLKVEGAGHDVVSTMPKYPGDIETEEKAAITYHQIYDFIQLVIAAQSPH